MNLTKIFRGNGRNVTLIHLMNCKPQYFLDEVFKCLVNKYQITYQNIWGRAGQTSFSGIRLL